MASVNGAVGEQDDPMDVGGEEQKLPELKLDARQAQGFISFFNKLPSGPEIVRFFDRRDYFTVHGENAVLVARTYYKTLTCLRQLGNPPDTLTGVSVSRSMFETIIRDLLLQRTDHIVELYEGSGSNWRLVKTGTPGNLRSFEDVLFSSNEMEDTPVLMALYPTIEDNEIVLGVAFVDTTKRILGMTQFLDDDQFTNLDSAMTALGCKECLIPQDGGGNNFGKRRLADVFVRCNVLLRERKRAEFKPRDVEQDLARLIKGTAEQVHGTKDLEAASAALAALLAYTELLSDDSAYGKYTLQQYKLDTYMRLDAAALQALNVFESRMDANKNFSLAGLMNRTCSAGMGKRMLNRWLKQPLLDIIEINQRLDIVQIFVERVDLRRDLRKHLKRIPDLERLIRKVEKRKATLFDIVKLFQVSMRLPFIKEALAQYDGEAASLVKEKYLNDLQEWTGPDHLGKFDGLVEAAIDLDHINEGEYVIDPEYDPALGELRAERNQVEEQIRKVYEQALDDLDMTDKTLKLDRAPQLGHVFRITKKEEPRVRKKLNAQYVTLETRKDGIKFTNAHLRRLSEQFQRLTDEYDQTQKELVQKVVDVTVTFLEIFEGVASLLAELDVLLGFADLSVSAPTVYVRPTITPSSEGDIILEGCRHPCVEAQEDVSFIPNDCRLVRGKSWFQIITGPNMGGKSTFIRQVGVNVLMAQVGCFVPCDRAEVSVRDCIFARVGAGDCQLRGVSTFMAEMLETASILKAATERSLIIIDELGRGTSTYDGFGLAWGICEYLTEVIRAPCLFATHFHELTALATRQGPPVHGPPRGPPVGIVNYHVSAHIDEASRKLTMLFKVEDGPCDQSFGIHVAEFAHFPESVVKMAREKAEQLEHFSTPSKETQSGNTTQVDMNGGQADDSAQDVIKGEARVRKFLRDLSSLALDVSREELFSTATELMKGLEEDSRSDLWLRELLMSLQPEK